MKRFIYSLFVGVGMALELCSCATSVEVSHPPPEGSSNSEISISVALPEPVPATQEWKIVIVTKEISDPYWQRVEKAALDYGEASPVQIEVVGLDKPQKPEFVEDQILLVEQQLQNAELDALILAPADSIKLVDIVEKAVQQGIPVAIIDTPLASTSILTYVGFDNFAAAETIGSWVVQQLDGQGKVVILQGSIHQDNALDRHNGFLAGLKTGKIQILSTRSANWDFQAAQAITSIWLAQHSNIDALIAADDQMALGALAAISAQGEEKDILVTGFDGSAEALAKIGTEELAVTIDQLPELQVKIALDLVINYLEKQETLPPQVLLRNSKLITVADFPHS